MLSRVRLRKFIRRGDGAGFDPGAKFRDLFRAQCRAESLGWHTLVQVGGADAFEEKRMIFHEHVTVVAAFAHRGGGVQAQVRLLFQGAMAGVAARLEQGLDLFFVIRRCGRGREVAGCEETRRHRERAGSAEQRAGERGGWHHGRSLAIQCQLVVSWRFTGIPWHFNVRHSGWRVSAVAVGRRGAPNELGWGKGRGAVEKMKGMQSW